MADGVDIISDTTGQQIVSALEGLTNPGNTAWVYFGCGELYENASSGITKDNVSIGSFADKGIDGENGSLYSTDVNDLIVEVGKNTLTNDYFVVLSNTEKKDSITSGTKISAPGKILMIKVALRNASSYSRSVIIVNNGGIVSHKVTLASKAYTTFTCDFTKNIYASSTCYLKALETEDMQVYAIAVCYES